MSYRSRVVWTEGLFLRQQHFQQLDRHVDFLLDKSIRYVNALCWGFSDFIFDRELLAVGKFSLSRGEGLFQDGTPFSFPDHDDAPIVLDLNGRNVRDEVMYLAIPAYRAGGIEARYAEDRTDELVRYRVDEVEIRDTAAAAGEGVPIQVGRLSLRFLMHSQVRDDYLCIPVARVIECQPSGSILIDDQYLATTLAIGGSGRLVGYLDETLKMLEQNGEKLAERAVGNIQAPQEIQNLLRLMAINRWLPVLRHLRAHDHTHPEDFFRSLIAICGELCAFARDRRAPVFPAYRQDDLTASFKPVLEMLRRLLMGAPDELSAEPIPIEHFGEGLGGGIFGAPLHNKRLLDRTFVLAVSASLPQEEIRSLAPRNLLVATEDTLKEALRDGQGMQIEPLAQVPPAIPFHAGYVYFRIVNDAAWWRRLAGAAGFAFHVQSNLPDIKLELWALQGLVV